MIRLTEPMKCPRCRRWVVPGETRWYDLDERGEYGDTHVCGCNVNPPDDGRKVQHIDGRDDA